MIAWRLNSMLLKNQWVKDEIKGNLKILQDKQKWENSHTKSMGCSKSSPKREVYSNIGPPQKQEKFQINNLICHLK